MIAESAALLAAGCLCAAVGGELFVRGLVGLANRSGIPKSVFAATIGAFATSAPELVVGLTSASKGVPELALGNVLGVNLVNICLVLGMPIAFFGMTVSRGEARRDLPFAIAIFPMLSFACFDGVISRSEVPLLLLIFSGWAMSLMVTAWRARDAHVMEASNPPPIARHAVAAGLGLLTLLLAGQLIVDGVTTIAVAAGVPAFIIGATAVALGTSIPELTAALLSMVRGHRDMGVSIILGSNIFNCLFVVAFAATITPIAVPSPAAALALAAGLVSTVLIIPFGNAEIRRWRGVFLLAMYFTFIGLSGAGFGFMP
jgi:cation:H+ antiporter